MGRPRRLRRERRDLLGDGELEVDGAVPRAADVLPRDGAVPRADDLPCPGCDDDLPCAGCDDDLPCPDRDDRDLPRPAGRLGPFARARGAGDTGT